jgi:flagellar biosynthesis anti-sigma factor FlgM
MTTPIGPVAPNTQTNEGGPAGRVVPSKPARMAGADAASQSQPGEAVTLSSGAQITTQLLDAARAASGVDQNAVTQARTAIQSGSYNVSPQDLANAITNAFKETP